MQEVIFLLIENYGLAGLVIANFLAYSIIPIPSEAAIIASTTVLNPVNIFLFSFVGATLGSILNYYIGYWGRNLYKKVKDKKKTSKREKQAERIFHRYGPISVLLLGWLPIIGDPLIIISGVFKMNFKKFLIYSSIGKIIYFIFLIELGTLIF